MNFSRRRAVSPIIASLLLIAIAVAAGIIVYVYVNSLAGGLTSGGGSQVSQQLQLQAYSFTGIATTGSSNGVLADVFLENTGSSSLTISSIYFDGNPLTQWYNTGSPTAYLQYFAQPTGSDCYALLSTSPTIAALTATQTTSGTPAGSCTTTASTTCGTGSAICFSTTAAENPVTSIAAQGTVQLVIGWGGGLTAGTSHTVKIVSANGGVSVFTVVAGRTG